MSKRVKTKVKEKNVDSQAEQTEQKAAFSSPKKEEKVTAQEETLIESAELLEERISRSQEYVERNKNIFIGAAVAVLLGVVLFFAASAYMGASEDEAQGELAGAVFFFEKDSLDKALAGDGNSTKGLLAIAEDNGSTKAGNLANFYAGVAYLKKGDFDKAIAYLDEFSASDLLIKARAKSLIGDAYMEKADYAKASEYYGEAVSHKPNEEFTPTYLMKLALANELKGDVEKAKSAYQRIITEFPNSRDVNNAKKYIAKFE